MTSDTQQDNAPPSCPLCGGGRKMWLLWVGILIFIVIFFYANRSASAPASFDWVESLDTGLARARETDQPILVNFHASWCPGCQMMDRTVFDEAKVAKALANWVPVSIDVDQNPGTADGYAVQNLPTLVVLNAGGQELARREGAMSAQDFLRFIQWAEKVLAAAGTPPRM